MSSDGLIATRLVSKSPTRFLAAFGICFMLVPVQVWALCAAPEPFEREFANSAAVFIGTVRSTKVIRNSDSPGDVDTVAIIEVERYWKGFSTQIIQVRTCGGVCTVGVRFLEGSRYIVFATGDELTTTSCQRTGSVKDSPNTMRWLERRPSRRPA
jgi:hypothetical protein